MMIGTVLLALALVAAPAPAQQFHDIRVQIMGPPRSADFLDADSFSLYYDGIVDIDRDGQERRYRSLGLVPKADREYFGRLYRAYRLTECRPQPSAPAWWRLRPGMRMAMCGGPA